MADEITVSTTLSVNKSDLEISKQVNRLQVDMAGDSYSANAQSIATSSTAVDIGSTVGTAGYAFFRNLDATNFVEIGVEDGGSTFIAFAKLKPGEVGMIRLATKSIYAKADTAAVILETLVAED